MRRFLMGPILISTALGCGKPNVPSPEQDGPPVPDGDDRIAVVSCDLEAPDDGPFGVATFLRGDMNEWDIVDRLCHQGAGVYAGVFRWNLGGLKKFKIADSTWDLQCTKPSDDPETDDLQSAYLVQAENSEEIECIVESVDGVGAQNGLKTEIGAGEYYTFILDASGSTATPLLSIHSGSGIPK